MRALCLCALTLAPFATSGALLSGGDGAADLKKFQGTWR
jgi:hypothetical protein